MMRRTKKLIKSGLQMKLVIAFSSMATISALFQVVLLNYSLMRLARDMVDSDLLLSSMSGLLVTNLLVTLAVLVPLMLVFGILITHRIAGPIYRFEQHLSSIARGEDPGRCALRKGDELQELCGIINDAVETLKEGAPSRSTEDEESPAKRAA